MNKLWAFLSGSMRTVSNWWSGASKGSYERPAQDEPQEPQAPPQQDYRPPTSGTTWSKWDRFGRQTPQPEPEPPPSGPGYDRPTDTPTYEPTYEPPNTSTPSTRPTKLGVPPSSGGGSSSSSDPMDAGAWWFEHSVGMPQHPSSPWYFDFPGGDGVHACVTGALRPENGKILRIRFKIENGSNLRAYNGGQPAGNAFMSLFLQRQGDNLSAQGAYGSYRFYTDQARELIDGLHDWEVPISADAWHNVWGQDDSGGFEACLSNLRVFGFVFGNPSAGATAHGVGGGGRFTLLSIEQI